MSCFTGHKWSDEPLIKQFLRAAIRIRPPRKSLFPAWDLGTVLKALLQHPFVPAETCPLWFLTVKLIFLTAITSVSRVSELQLYLAKILSASFSRTK